MVALNVTPSDSSIFILNGVPGMEAAHIWISIPFAMFYFMSLLGGVMVLFVICKEKTLHKPMYFLLYMLAITDIGMSTCIMPKALGIFWFGFKDITLEACITQMFFLYAMINMHSAVLMTMAFDRYIAICDPLRYSTILSNARLAKLALLCLTRAIVFNLPFPLLLRRLPFCRNHIIPHTYCEHSAVMKISCGDTTVNRMYGLGTTFVVIGLDLTLIGLSYGLIMKAVLRISTKKAYQKALSTCSAHICVILVSYTLFLFSVLTHRFGQGIPAHIHILLANFYLLLPSMLNPIIYGVKSKDFCYKLRKYICKVCLPGATDLKLALQNREMISPH